MKTSTEQQKLLRQYLRKSLKYRETYIEFYDHILTALEEQSIGVSFQDAINSIIREDFGGIEGMAAIEARYQKAAKGEMKNKYFDYFIECLKPPLIGITVALAILFYWITKQTWFNFSVFFEIFFTMRLIPAIVNHARWFKIGYTFLDTKKSVKDSFYMWLDYIPALIFVFLLFITPHARGESSIVGFKNANPFYITAFFVIYGLHIITYYRIYRNEFKISLTS